MRKEATFDPAGRITAITDPLSPAANQGYDYDVLDRLTEARSGNPVVHTRQFGYDAVGNRRTLTVDSALSKLTYEASNNRLQTLTGALPANYALGGGGWTFTYNLANRMVAAHNNSLPVATYRVNALGQRVSKTAGGASTHFVYDEQGRLLGEYDGAGNLIQETVWLEDLPVATLRPAGSGNPAPIAIYYVHADHLGSPRAITRPADNATMWQWDNVDPFGANLANENPTGKGTFKYALRFPGQYFDGETGTHYNYFRDYDPNVGRYVESDPIGLAGGLNMFAYVANTPLRYIDSQGLVAEVCSRWFYPVPAPYARHCFVRFNGNDTDTSSYDSDGVHKDPAPSWWPKSCTPAKGDPDDECVRREMAKCTIERYDFTNNNCCHCAETAVTRCGLRVSPWPNWPVNPAPQRSPARP